MAIEAFSQFADGGAVQSTDILVGLRSGANNRFTSLSSLLFAANNLSDVASAPDAFNNISPATIAGDMIYFNGTTNERLAIGTTNQIMTVQGGEPVWESDITVNSIKTGVVNGLTAHAGGGQGSATALTAAINRVTTVATAADSVKLPAAVAGTQVVVVNAAASNAMNVFPSSGDSINALAANTALSVAANKTSTFYCAVNGIWDSIVTA